MSPVLYHHPHTRAASVVWMLEEVGEPYELVHVDIRGGAQKAPEHVERNPMGKVPVLVDDGVVVTETAAIGVYLADRYAPGRLAPALDDPDRGPYLRWAFFAPSVIEPGASAHASAWEFRPGSAGWGTFDAMHDAIESAIGDGPYILGDRFTMVDCIFGSTLRWLLQFKMLEARPRMVAYAERLGERPALKAANARNAAELAAHG